MLNLSDPTQVAQALVNNSKRLSTSAEWEALRKDIATALADAWSRGFADGSLNENGVQKAVRDGHKMPAPPQNPYVKQGG